MSESRDDYQKAREVAIEELIKMARNDDIAVHEARLGAARELLSFSLRTKKDSYSIKKKKKE